MALLRGRQSGGLSAVRRQFDELEHVLKSAKLKNTAELKLVQAEIRRGREATDLDQAEDHWRRALEMTENLIASTPQANFSIGDRAALAKLLTGWECADLGSQLASTSNSDAIDTSVTVERLQAYLREHFDEPNLHVSDLTPLAGGFGKETLIFSAKSAVLDGEFVMRRDLGAGLPLANDCHVISREFAVIQAVRSRGFPAPDALWLDTSHKSLPGGDFIIMRRAPGVMGGSFFGASNASDETLPATLAGIAARLHGLPPLTELGDLASFIKAECWRMSRSEAAHAYIRDWFNFFRASDHTPSPALMAIYGWLFDNVPKRSGPATLLHGDLGFHNFLFENGRLTAVLDWEFAHVGDPAEELGYIAVTTQGALDWSRFIDSYIEAGGDPVDAQTLHFFKVWAYIRNASAANLQSTLLQAGKTRELKLSVLPYVHFPHFIRQAEALIAAGPEA